MARAGDSFVITLSEAHLEWGTYRRTGSREPREGEGYIPIPVDAAKAIGLYNSNGTDHRDIMGKNLFRFKTADGMFQGVLKAQGNTTRGAVYAKQFSAVGDLRLLGDWFKEVHAEVGDQIRVVFTSPTELVLEKI